MKHSNASTQDQTRLKAWTRVLSASKPKAIQGRDRGRVHDHAQFSARGNVSRKLNYLRFGLMR
jgi:hypothetical protein